MIVALVFRTWYSFRIVSLPRSSTATTAIRIPQNSCLPPDLKFRPQSTISPKCLASPTMLSFSGLVAHQVQASGSRIRNGAAVEGFDSTR
jgi:hypothetical protein